MSKPQVEDYQALIINYQKLSNGEKAAIRREIEPDDLKINPVFYRLIQGTIFVNTIAQAARLIYFLPYLELEKPSIKRLGAFLGEKSLNERRLFLIVRNEYPQDLVHLRRVLQQFKPVAINISQFLEMVYFWGDTKETSKRSKERLMQDYYLADKNQLDELGEAAHASH